jgi:hypothetical protein
MLEILGLTLRPPFTDGALPVCEEERAVCVSSALADASLAAAK